jgi:hypothetical protein
MDKPIKLPAHKLRELAVEAHADPRTVQKVYAGLPVRGAVVERVKAALRAATLIGALLLAQSCAQEGVGSVAPAAVDASPLALQAPGRGAGAVPDAAPVLADLGADPQAAEAPADSRPSPDVAPELALEVGVPPDTRPGADLPPDVVPPAPEVGTDAPPPIPETCTSSKVKANGHCDGYWPGTSSPQVPCVYSCRDYAAGSSAPLITISNPLLGCNSYEMTSDITGHPVVCLSGQSFCDIYCPGVK